MKALWQAGAADAYTVIPAKAGSQGHGSYRQLRLLERLLNPKGRYLEDRTVVLRGFRSTQRLECVR